MKGRHKLIAISVAAVAIAAILSAQAPAPNGLIGGIATLAANVFSGTQTAPAYVSTGGFTSTTGYISNALHANSVIIGNNAYGAGVSIGNVGTLGFSSTNDATFSNDDAGISRVSAGMIGVGNAQQGTTSGGLQATIYQSLNALTVGSLPACASGTLGQRRQVSDATVATPGSAATGSGTYTIGVQCIFNSTGSVYSWIID